IHLSGYTEEEKMGIARNYLLPRQLEEHGLKPESVLISDPTLRMIVSHYTREAGVRNMEREIANALRKVAKQIAEGKVKTYRITPANLHKFLGVPKYLPEGEQDRDEVGVSTGLAWTESGGDIIFIEATTMKGRGGLTLTGHLGEVMKESAQAALSYIRSRSKHLGIPTDFLSKHDVHIHVPAGAIPKDGPSAGITMATAIASTFLNIPVNHKVAMTGEVTLRGRVLPIGGLKEKLLAARRAKIQTVILPKLNEKDVEDVPRHVRQGLNLVFVETMDEVLPAALKRPQPSRGKTPRNSRSRSRALPPPGKRPPSPRAHA
ncbi:MAG: endopeptidase La, partial [Nitrospirae bacterium]|nr:endopeptidase La [Nitrospirota bacterium]